MPGPARTETEGRRAEGTTRGRRGGVDIHEGRPATVREALQRLEGTIDAKVDYLVRLATLDALAQLPDNHDIEAENKINTAIEKRLRPHIEENEVIAAQIDTVEYDDYVKEIQGFLGTQVGDTVCADGRIASVALIAPRVGHIHRRLAGMPDIRYEIRGGQRVPVIDDPMIDSAIETAIEAKKKLGVEEPEIVEFIGGHINSAHPLHGCGAQTGEVTSAGRPAATAMQYGGLEEWHERLGDGKEAFNNVIKDKGGRGTTFDMVHDIHSQGLIFGLGNLYNPETKKIFDRSIDPATGKPKTLRANLVEMHNSKKILMTELLAQQLEGEIMAEAAKQGVTETLTINDPYKLAENVMRIGRIAKAITARHEEQDFAWMPDALKEGNSANVIRTLAYRAVRNSVYQKMCGIEPGNHNLILHPEQLIRVGPIGAAFNVRDISFIEATPEKARLRDEDIAGTKALYKLFEGVAPNLPAPIEPIDLTKEGRIIIVTEKYEDETHLSESILKHDMARLRDEFRDGVNNGEAIIIGMMHRAGSRSIEHVVCNAPGAQLN